MDDVRPSIAIVPYGIRIDRDFALNALSTLDWPLGMPDRLAGEKIRDLRATDHLIFFPTSTLWLGQLRQVKAKISLMIVEPKAVHRRHMILARIFHKKFAFVMTCNPSLLSAIPNGIKLPFGTSWVPEWESLSLAKTHDISLIASNKKDLKGHRLRHAVAAWAQIQKPELKLLGRAFEPFEKKADGLSPYRYSIIIENVREPSYFTEKLIDALLCKCIPIYWGAPNIDEFFLTEGMIICDTLQDIKEAISQTSDQDYIARESALAENQKRAAQYLNLHKRAALSIAAKLTE